MCGIYCELCTRDSSLPAHIHIDKQLKHFLNSRGPDSQNLISKVITTDRSERHMVFYGTVLWMQGKSLTPQPLENDTGIMVYNGDIFDSEYAKTTSDSTQIMEKFSYHSDKSSEDRKQHILRMIAKLKGPFSIVYYDKILKLLFFSRDTIGRNSLLFCKKEDSFIISSVLGRKYEKTVEIPASHIFTIDLHDLSISSHDRTTLQCTEQSSVDMWIQDLYVKQSLPDDLFHHEIAEFINPGPEDVKLINFIESTARNTKCRLEMMRTILRNVSVLDIVDKLTCLLKASVKVRIETQPYKCKECVRADAVCYGHCTVGVLFSGGLDCTILAMMADEYLPKDQPIDLINVAFKCDKNGCYDVPDRLTGRQAVAELKSLRPERKWVFHEVNVTAEELRRAQEHVIADLVHPRYTILDESLGSALWFAAQAADHRFTSSCRVLLLGSGADELFGGYTRHRNALKRSSWAGLSRELWLDWRRISSRNLARDNRVMGHHGRQPRMPYLDEDFTKFVLQLKPWQRCIPSNACGPGLGDKLFLRLLAYRLGLTHVSGLPKRALQFGSRIANKKENGADISERFKKL